MAKVMILDHELMDVIAMEDALREAGYNVVTLTGPWGVLAKFDYEKPDILLFNPDMPNADSDLLLDTIIQAPQMTNMAIIVTCHGDADLVSDYCHEKNLHGYYMKDQGFENLVPYLCNFIPPN